MRGRGRGWRGFDREIPRTRREGPTGGPVVAQRRPQNEQEPPLLYRANYLYSRITRASLVWFLFHLLYFFFLVVYLFYFPAELSAKALPRSGRCSCAVLWTAGPPSFQFAWSSPPEPVCGLPWVRSERSPGIYFGIACRAILSRTRSHLSLSTSTISLSPPVSRLLVVDSARARNRIQHPLVIYIVTATPRFDPADRFPSSRFRSFRSRGHCRSRRPTLNARPFWSLSLFLFDFSLSRPLSSCSLFDRLLDVECSAPSDCVSVRSAQGY